MQKVMSVLLADADLFAHGINQLLEVCLPAGQEESFEGAAEQGECCSRYTQRSATGTKVQAGAIYNGAENRGEGQAD